MRRTVLTITLGLALAGAAHVVFAQGSPAAPGDTQDHGATPSLGLRLPTGLYGLGSQNILLFKGRVGIWQLVQVMVRNLLAPLTIVARIAGSCGSPFRAPPSQLGTE